MASEHRYLQQRYAESTFNRTWKGQSFGLMRNATGFYCIFRGLIVRPYDHIYDPSHKTNSSRQSLSNILFPAPHANTPTDSRRSPDILASILLLLIPNPSPPTEANLRYATHQVNLGFVGAVIIGSIQQVLHGAARALRATPASAASRNRVASLVLLVLAQLMARPLQSSLRAGRTNVRR